MGKGTGGDGRGIDNCIKCGFCRAVCPVFQELGTEASVARGKVALIESMMSGKPITKAMMKRISLCLLCKACVANCPSGVRVDKAIIEARAIMFRRLGSYPIKKAIFRYFLKPRRIMPLGLTIGSRFQGIVLKSVSKPGFYQLRIPLTNRVFPGLSGGSFERVYKPEKAGGKVAFFTGCLMRYAFTGMAESVIGVLNKLGIEVHMINGQQCCGLPALANGDRNTARGLVANNVNLFHDYMEREGLDTIVVACASCGSTLKHEWPELISATSNPGDPLLARTLAISGRVHDISEYLIDVLGLEARKPDMKPIHGTVTYHDPCHLVRGQGITAQPRRLLGLIPGLEFREMSAPAKCCGSGGSFSISHYGLSRSINDAKVADIANTGADFVATGCPGCIMHMTEGISLNSLPLDVCHTLELLNRSMA